MIRVERAGVYGHDVAARILAGFGAYRAVDGESVERIVRAAVPDPDLETCRARTPAGGASEGRHRPGCVIGILYPR